MRGKLLALIAGGVLSSAAAVAGLNPASPGLPTVTDNTIFGGARANNQLSAMCIDCHTRIPKDAAATHYSSQTAGQTRSGGGGISTTGGLATRDNSQYFRLAAWTITSGTISVTVGSKYGDATNGVSTTTTKTPGGIATVVAAGSGYDSMELICESCHNIIYNAPGGNNLLAKNPGTTVDYTTQAESTICVGCHGFMYSDNSANSANTNWADTRNNRDVGGAKRGNNEVHWVKGSPYAQNHHVMTGDSINDAMAAAGLLWTDNLIVSYSDDPIVNNSSKGTYNVVNAWAAATPRPTDTANLACTNCHAVAHGGDVTSGAAFLRGTAGGTAATAISRYGDGGRGWKKINDGAYCGQCHARP